MGSKWKILSALVIVTVALSNSVQSQRYRGSRANRESIFPLIAEHIPEVEHSRRTQCHFSGKLYDIGATWNPNMSENDSEPVVDYCIVCNCQANRRKKRMEAKSHCKNISSKCPALNCKDPVTLPGRCCKSCPGDPGNLEGNLTKPATPSDTKKKTNYYAVMKTIESDRQSVAYMQLNRGHLLFVIETQSTEKPKSVRFYNDENDRIEEFYVDGTTRDTNNFRIYGNWSSIPKEYRRMVRKGQMKIALAFKSDESDNDYDDDNSEMMGTILKFTIRATKLVSPRHNQIFDLLSARKPNLDDYLRTMFKPPPSLVKAMNDGEDNPNAITESHCYYEARKIDEGSQWVNENDVCQMCTCKRGNVDCKEEVCMNLNCREQIRVPGQCCPVCRYSETSGFDYKSDNATCSQGDRKYHVGSKWHPFMPPQGFDKCTTCSCNSPGRATCERIKCPPLNCMDSDAYQAPGDCCRRCPSKVYDPQHAFMGTMADDPFVDPILAEKLSKQKILAEGGCLVKDSVRMNGEEWSPVIGFFGADFCVKCRCKDGKDSCENVSSKCVVPTDCVPIKKIGECCLVCQSESNTRGGRKGASYL